MSGNDIVCFSGSKSRDVPLRLGTPHYSYRFAEQKFVGCLSTMEIDTHFISMPEYYSAPASYLDLPTYQGRLLHIIFRSTEEIRILKGGYNIVCYAWEFPYIKDTTKSGEHPFLNQKRMLSLCEEIWVPCTFTAEVLAAHGLTNVHRIPAPITSPSQTKLPRAELLTKIGHIGARPFIVNFLGSGSTGRGDGRLPLFSALTDRAAQPSRKVFLSIFNPEDFRKNLDALVRGFDFFLQRSGRDDLLLIKAVTSTDRFSLDQVIRDVMLNKLEPGTAIENENILVFNDLLSTDEMTLLYDLADFYVCTSIAEGQNLPLQEAMIREVVPVTTVNTAMLDYVDGENAVVIAADRRWNSCEHLAGNIAERPYEVEICSAKQVADALDRAVDLAQPVYARMATAARTRIEDNYTCSRIRPLITERLRADTSN